jgi:uncharacterized membrane protein
LGNGRHGFDPYPFILLNLLLSCVAALQGAILLIAAKREDQISSELAVHDYQTNLEASQIVHAILDLTKEIHAHLCLGDSPPGASGETGLPDPAAGDIAHGGDSAG